jgi:hypothetical protein
VSVSLYTESPRLHARLHFGGSALVRMLYWIISIFEVLDMVSGFEESISGTL